MLPIFYHDQFVLPLPEGHRFPMAKYRLLREQVQSAGVGALQVGAAATDAQLLRAHSADYIQRVQDGRLSEKEQRRIGFPWSPAMVERSRRSTGSTVQACRAALAGGYGVNLAGGTHHAHWDWGQGYCVFNDVVVGARAVQAEGLARRVVVLDCDVHQGNGTAAITRGDSSIFTFSIHGAKNFPFHKEPGDLDVPLPDGADDATYLAALEEGLWRALWLARADLAIYIAGVDPYVGDRLGKLALSKAGLLARDRLVLEACREAGLPVAVVMGGGYAADPAEIAALHWQTVQLTAEFAAAGQATPPVQDRR